VISHRNREREEAHLRFRNVALPQDDSKLIQVFNLKAFIECLLKMGIGYLSFHGTPDQAKLPTHAKFIWLMTYLNCQFTTKNKEYKITMDLNREIQRRPSILMRTQPKFVQQAKINVSWTNWKKVPTQNLEPAGESIDDAMTRMKSEGFHVPSVVPSPDNTQASFASGENEPLTAAQTGRNKLRKVVQSRKHTAYLPPLQRLMVRSPNMFNDAPKQPPFIKGETFERIGACLKCNFVPIRGWGNACCSLCGLGDTILQKCLTCEGVLIPADLPVLDQIVLSWQIAAGKEAAKAEAATEVSNP